MGSVGRLFATSVSPLMSGSPRAKQYKIVHYSDAYDICGVYTLTGSQVSSFLGAKQRNLNFLTTCSTQIYETIETIYYCLSSEHNTTH